jgi:ABC-2 type transport system ATP-binding protein
VIDHGSIVAIGTSAELKAKTGKETLEEAFLALTGHAIRDEAVSSADSMRQQRQMWRGKAK